MGRLQNEDFKSSAELVSAGGTAAQLLNDSKIYVTANSLNKTLSAAITAGDIGGGVKDWTTSTAYVAGNIVTYEKAFYTCISNHTSGATFEADFNLAFWQQMASPQVAKNYMAIANNFESNTVQGWSACKSATLSNGFPTAVGTGGNPFSSSNGGTAATTAQSPTVTSSNPLSGSYSLNFTTNASGTTAGDMYISPAIPIDKIDQAKVLAFRFGYQLVSDSGNVTNFSGTSANSFGVAIYDLTNNVWIQPAGVFNLVQKTGVGVASGTFQTFSNTTKVQIAVYCPTASGASTVSLYLDEFYIGQQPSSIAPAMDDWVAYTPTFVGFGTTTSVQFWSRRVGDSLQVRGNFNAGTPTAVTNTISIGYKGVNSNVSIDTTKSQPTALVGSATGAIANTTQFGWTILSGQTDPKTVHLGIQTSTLAGTQVLNGNQVSGTGTLIECFFQVPIVGWSSNTVSSADTDSRVIAFRAYRTATQSIINAALPVKATFDVASEDTAGAFVSGLNRYVIPVPGFYKITTRDNWGNGGGAGTSGFVASHIYIDGSPVTLNGNRSAVSGGFDMTSQASYLAKLNAGQYVEIFVDQNTAANRTIGSGSTAGFFAIERLSGPAVVQATETVAASYTSTTPTSVPSGTLTLIPYSIKKYDSHNAYTPATGYVIPVSGKYRITASIMWNVGGWSTSGLANNCYLGIYKNNSLGTPLYALMEKRPYTGEPFVVNQGSATVNCVAGDLIAIHAFQNSGLTYSIINLEQENYFMIERVGN